MKISTRNRAFGGQYTRYERATLILGIIIGFIVYLYSLGKFTLTKNMEINANNNLLWNTLFETSPNCPSVFTLGANDKNYSKVKIPNWINIQRDLELIAKGKKKDSHSVYRELSRYLHQGYIWNYKMKLAENSTSYGVISSFVYVMDENAPYMQCNMHDYQSKDKKQCFEILKSIGRRKLRLAFLGDSFLRLVMETFVTGLKEELSLKYVPLSNRTDLPTDFLNKKLKQAMLFDGVGLTVRFYWAPYLHFNSSYPKTIKLGARDVFERWVTKLHLNEDFPDVIFLNSGLWEFVHKDIPDMITSHIRMFEVILPMLEKLSRMTRIIFLVTTPTKPWLRTKFNFPSEADEVIIDLLNQIKRQKLANLDIWIWDSLNPIVYKEINECKRFLTKENLLNMSVPNRWGCKDYNHAGHRTLFSSVNMIYNFLCNKVKQKDNSYCCAS